MVQRRSVLSLKAFQIQFVLKKLEVSTRTELVAVVSQVILVADLLTYGASEVLRGAC